MDFNLKAVEFQLASEVRVDLEGKAFFTIRGVARLADVDERAVRRAFEGADIKPSKMVRTLTQYGFDSAAILNFGKTGIPDIAVAVIINYYAMFAGERCTKQAKKVAMTLTAVGIRAYSHKIVGYHQVEIDYRITLQQLLEGQVPSVPTKYYPKYHLAFWDALERCYGLKRGQWACGRFINCYIYGYLPAEVQTRLKEVNPLQDNGTRENKFHQHLDDVMLQLMLNRLVVITALLDVSTDRQAFKKIVRRIPKIKFNQNNIKVLKGVS